MLLSIAREVTLVQCRVGCGACCIAPSISVAIPGMPQGKPAGIRCIQLDHNHRCLLFNSPERPAVCAQFQPESQLCGSSREQALQRINVLEKETA